MKTVELLMKNYNIPTSWLDISIKHYQKIHKLLDVETDSGDDLNDLFKQIEIISAYIDVPVDVLKKENPQKILNLIQDLKFLQSEIPSKQITMFNFNKQTYYVIQSLMETQFQDYVSLENLLQREDFVGNLHYILAVMCRKTFEETLDDYDVDKRAKEFLDLDMVTVNNIAVFFYSVAKTLNLTSLLSSNPKEIVEAKIQEVKTSLIPQAGMGWYMRWQHGFIVKWFYSYIRQLKKSYIFTQQKS